MRCSGVLTMTGNRLAAAGNRGFTLLEVMVSLAIFSLLSVASYQFLRSLSLASETVMTSEERRWQLETGLLILEQDMRYLIPRSSRKSSAEEASGAEEDRDAVRSYPALTNRHGTFLEFSRSGLPADISAQRHAPGRVVYRLEEGEQGKTLRRAVYRAVDTTQRSTAEQQLFSALEAVSLRFMGEDGAWRNLWPPAIREGRPADKVRLPVAVEIAFTLRDQAPITRVISLR